MTEKPIIAPVSRVLLKQELDEQGRVSITRKGNNEIYIINHHTAPNVMLEIGRLREETFRKAGGGTGKEVDIDDYDTMDNGYEQLIVWSPEEEEIIGGYRFILCENILKADGSVPKLSTALYFSFESRFITSYLPKTIELGRSWVQPNYQPSVNPRKGLFALDNIWDGLGALTHANPHIEYFFGKVTMYPEYTTECRDFLLYFLHYYFPDSEKLMTPHIPLEQNDDKEAFAALLKGLDFKEGFRVLNQFVRSRGENIPPLINIYMHLSPSMKTFGTAINPDFGGVEETAILVSIADIYEEKKTRHLELVAKNEALNKEEGR
ncbi:MAG: GNAT family N-acetyltransferase [Bacteroidia bacterium]